MARAIKFYHLSVRKLQVVFHFLLQSLLGHIGKNFNENFSSSLFRFPCFSQTKVRTLPSLFRRARSFCLCTCYVRGMAREPQDQHCTTFSCDFSCPTTLVKPMSPWQQGQTGPKALLMVSHFATRSFMSSALALDLLGTPLSHLTPPYMCELKG